MAPRLTFRALWLVLVASALAGAMPLGANYGPDSKEITFSLYSSRATRVEVWIYSVTQGQGERARYELARDGANIWSVTVQLAELRSKGVDGTVYYGYRAWGPNWTFAESWVPGSKAGFFTDVDEDGNRFNPNKLLVDPYAKEVSHDYLTEQHRDAASYLSGSHRADDTALFAPKGIVLADRSGAIFGTKPRRPFKDDIIYEAHLRGLTANDGSIPVKVRGTYAGAALKAPDLKALGVTAIEFLPVFEFQNDTNGLTPNSAVGDNYWGYDPDNFFSPDRRYAADRSPGGPTQEFKAMVKAFHDQDIKVYLDVVYNHTGEGDVDGNTGRTGRIQSWRGIDNPAYYQLRDDNGPYEVGDRPSRWDRNRYYSNNNGVGPNVNAAGKTTQDMVLDSLKYWSNEMGVDGFRFDLAAVLGNTQEHDGFQFDNRPATSILNRAAKELPTRDAAGSGVELIAEPYGARGGGTFQLGNFPAGWAEWNDRFRYPIRRSQNKLGIAGMETAPVELIRDFSGSSDVFQPSGRKPYHGVNYVVVHDGFTLRDLYSYNEKRNDQPFPLGPSPGGSDNNLSWDQGGDAVAQRQAGRTGLALTMLSAGVPLIVSGDEMFRTQSGNNNPFNLDNKSFYLDYADRTTFAPYFRYTKALIAFRRAHAALRRAEFFDGRDHNGNGVKDITWIRDDGREADASYLNNPANHFIGFRLDGTEIGDTATSIYVAYNGWHEDINATLPDNLPTGQWHTVLDTSSVHESNSNVFVPANLPGIKQYKVTARSVGVFVE